MREFRKSHKLDDVLYDIRGPVMREAARLEEEGFRILKFNIGNPAPFGFEAPEEIIHDIVINLPRAQGYCDSRGVFSARKAVMQDFQAKGIRNVGIDDIYIGNGVSELITMSMQGLLDDGDEILIPAPDYPLWTAAATLAGGRPVHYLCDDRKTWYPDLADLEAKISPNTKGIVVINPNNPTGSVYPREILEPIIELARRHRLILFADEIYEKILYDGRTHIPLASLSDDVLTITFSGLSKAYRVAGFRAGWMVLTGNRAGAEDYIEGLDLLANMRLCANVPSQYGIQTALGGYQSINDLLLPGGRLRDQRDYFYKRLNAIEGLSCIEPGGALYFFVRLDTDRFGITDDQQFVFDLLRETKILAVQGTGFNWPRPDHFRMVFLPSVDILEEAGDRMERFFRNYRQS